MTEGDGGSDPAVGKALLRTDPAVLGHAVRNISFKIGVVARVNPKNGIETPAKPPENDWQRDMVLNRPNHVFSPPHLADSGEGKAFHPPHDDRSHVKPGLVEPFCGVRPDLVKQRLIL